MTAPAPELRPPEPGEPIEPTRFRPPSIVSALPRPRLPWTQGIVALILLLTLWSAWFVLTARSVVIDIEPVGARIDMRGMFTPRIGDRWLLRPGRHGLRASAPGYKDFTGQVTITGQSLQSHPIRLERLPGHLRVIVSPVEQAQIFVDGEARGTVPGIIRDIAAGSRNIEIRAERYLSFATELAIEGKGIEQRIEARLAPAWAAVSLATRPPGAIITVDGKPLGPAPRDFELLQGRRAVALALPGYKPWQQTLTVVAGQAVKLGTVVLSKADGLLALSSEPAAATVTLDGAFVGRTPLDVTVTPDKAHRLRLIKEGYEPLEQSLQLDSGKRDRLALTLTPELATLRLDTQPADAELLIDGKPAGNATQILSLPTHAHELTVRRAGYATYQTTVTPRKGVEKRYRIRLKTQAEAGLPPAAAAPSQSNEASADTAPAGTRPGVATTSLGQELKLFLGGRAVLGSPRRDSARRPNEIEREVILARPFYLAAKEVSTGEYRRFLANHAVPPHQNQVLDNDLQPVAGVSWQQAALYCNWLSRQDGLPPFYQIKFGEVLGIHPDATGYRLPTEAEWEWAARMPPKGPPNVYAWGGIYPPRGRSGNYADSTAATLVSGAIAGYTDGFAVAAPGGSFSANLRGLYDLGGNVAEWVHDYYDAAPAPVLATDPLGPPAGQQHVIKGASWAQGSATELRLAYRDSGGAPRNDLGFRLARYAQ